jgi:hypothetical protein
VGSRAVGGSIFFDATGFREVRCGLALLRSILSFFGSLVDTFRSLAFSCQLSGMCQKAGAFVRLITGCNSRPMMDQQGALAKKLPLAPFAIKETNQHASLDERQSLVWHIPHSGIARNNYLASCGGKSLDPRSIIFLEVVIFPRFWGEQGSACYLNREQKIFFGGNAVLRALAGSWFIAADHMIKLPKAEQAKLYWLQRSL